MISIVNTECHVPKTFSDLAKIAAWGRLGHLGTTEAPPLFVIGENKQAELVNYRVQGRYYVIDRLISVAELRLGSKKQEVVRIERQRDGRS